VTTQSGKPFDHAVDVILVHRVDHPGSDHSQDDAQDSDRQRDRRQDKMFQRIEEDGPRSVNRGVEDEEVCGLGEENRDGTVIEIDERP